VGRIVDVQSPHASLSGRGVSGPRGAGLPGGGLTWDPNPPAENVTAYFVYYGNASGIYNGGRSPINVGLATSYLYLPIDMSGTVFFAVVAQNAQGLSAFSNEVSEAY